MPNILKIYSEVFWDQYPISARLTRPFVWQKVDRLYIGLFTTVRITSYGMSASFHLFTTRSRTTYYSVQRLIVGPWPLRVSLGFIAVSLYLLFALFMVPLVIVVFAALFCCLIAATAILFAWLVVMLGSFALWACIYRYPFFDVALPRVRTRVLVQNARIYSPLPLELPMIRLVRIKAGRKGDPIDCELVVTSLAMASFEALSYVWGVTIRPYRITMDGQAFHITCNLHSALGELRLPDRERCLWIDAISINQHDNEEKGSQVQMMREIYAKASRTIVWLGGANSSTAATFEYMRCFNSANPSGRDQIWNERARYPRWSRIRKELFLVLEGEWWQRAWIIQEAVVSKAVGLQRGAYQVGWNELHSLLSWPSFGADFLDSKTTVQFVKDVHDLRKQVNEYGAAHGQLFDLVYRFRLQTATFASDKIYALMGLLKPDNPSLLVPDYSKAPEDVFTQFTISSLECSANLLPIVTAADASLQGMSWCRDWRLSYDGVVGTVGFRADKSLNRQYSASGTQGPIFRVNLHCRVISLQGFEIDRVARVASFCTESETLFSWEDFAGGPFSRDSEALRSFDRTITAGNENSESIDWRKGLELEASKTPAENAEMEAYQKTLLDACHERRFFITEKGRFGLGPWRLKKADVVCILFGGETPLILRPVQNPKKTRLLDEEEDIPRVYHRLVGEAYVDGLMHYEGSMEVDIKNASVVPKWYHLQ